MVRAPLLLILLLPTTLVAQAPPFEFTRLVAHWDAYGRPDYLKFIEEAQPEVAQVGFYGAHFYSLVHTAEFGGYPAHFPVPGLDECSEWFRKLNGQLHERGVKVVGHFNVEFLVGDPESPEGPRGFFRWYRDLWDEATLGPKPVTDPVTFLEKKADGTPIMNRTYAIGGMNEYWACLRNPAWQQVLKAWVRRGVDLGLDGFMINYFYRHDCVCEHCQSGFRTYLRGRFAGPELRDRFGLDDLETHVFPEIVSWHDPKESTPLRREMLRFSQISNKQVFDDVFLKYGRSLKPDLIVGQWNHLGDFSAISGDERCLLPAELWSKDESYLWYSTGGSANFTDLKNGVTGDGTLQARFIRGASEDKPFTLGKYEATRIRSAIAELAANGGAPMGFYTRFTDPATRAEIVRSYQFLKRHDALYRNNKAYTEATLLYPRSAVHRGELKPLAAFRERGRKLLDEHVLFDVMPDDSPPGSQPRLSGDGDTLPEPRSRFQAPFTIRVSASRPAGTDNKLDFHFVNYNRHEPPPAADGSPSPGTGIQDEKPISADPVVCDILLPEGATVADVQFISPEDPTPRALEWKADGGRLHFTSPTFLVYAVVRVSLRQ